MSNATTQRFMQVHDHLIESGKIRSSRKFAQSLDYLPQSLSEIIKGRREANVTLLQKLIDKYNVSPAFLFSQHGHMFDDQTITEASDVGLVVVTDSDDRERIVHVPIAAQAGYTEQANESVFIKDLTSFSLPDARFDHGTHRCFDVSGDSMEPTIYSGEKIICSFQEPDYWQNSIKDNLVYVVVSKDDVLVKRVVNKIKDGQALELYSDNQFYDPYPMPIEDVKEVWLVHTKISPFMQSPGNVRNGFQSQVDGLRDVIKNQSDSIRGLNSTIEKLLKMSRKTQ